MAKHYNTADQIYREMGDAALKQCGKNKQVNKHREERVEKAPQDAQERGFIFYDEIANYQLLEHIAITQHKIHQYIQPTKAAAVSAFDGITCNRRSDKAQTDGYRPIPFQRLIDTRTVQLSNQHAGNFRIPQGKFAVEGNRDVVFSGGHRCTISKGNASSRHSQTQCI